MDFGEAFEICSEKAKLHFKKAGNNLYDKCESLSGDYYENEETLDFVNNRWIWLTSMVTGMAPLLFEITGERKFLIYANKFKKPYHDKVFKPYTMTMHDLGFLYIPYSCQLYDLTGDEEHLYTALKAADELCKRFNVNGKFIDAWSDMDSFNKEGRMIIDSTMNSLLLMWAWKKTNHTFYYDVAKAHIDTIIKTLVRDDYSVAHAWFFDPETGEKKGEANSCGYANGSHWARGTAWLVFGLSFLYSYTKDEKIMDVAIKVGEKYIEELKGELVPPWDFRLPEEKPAKMCGHINPSWDETKEENKIYNVDTSASAIISCGFMMISEMTGNNKFGKFAEETLLCLSNKYLNTDLSVEGMLKSSNGRNMYTTYGDYFYMLALSMKLFNIKSSWQANE